MAEILLKNNSGFKWLNQDGISFKGYFKRNTYFFNSNNLYEINNEFRRQDKFLSFLNEANGFFAIVNEDEKYIFAAVDRVRSIPLFYAQKNGKFYLSDDARWIRDKVKDQDLDEISKTEFLLTGYVTGKDTLYPNVKQLQAGEYLIYNKETKKLVTEHYFQFRHSNFYYVTNEELVSLLDQVHVNVFKRLIESLNGRTAVVPLSGGYDSRLIVTMLKRLGYENVICFSYGKEGNKESMVSKKVADFLGYKWIFIPYTKDGWYKWYNSQEKQSYFRYADGLSSLPHIQDIIAVSELKKRNLIPSDSIFIPGHSGDFVAGSHIPTSFVGRDKISNEKLTEEIFKKHYSLWKLKSLDNSLKLKFRDKIYSLIPNKPIYSTEEAADLFECWDWAERQAKFICNSVRVYDFLDYEWRIPLWDNEIMEFWSKINIINRIGRKLYFEYVSTIQNEYKDIGINNPQINTLKKRLITFIKKIPFLHFYLLKIRKINEYNTHPLEWYGIVSRKYYNDQVKKGMENINSLLVVQYINIID
jgi:asparagine synthase (glutamine-hydrolysing)